MFTEIWDNSPSSTITLNPYTSRVRFWLPKYIVTYVYAEFFIAFFSYFLALLSTKILSVVNSWDLNLVEDVLARCSKLMKPEWQYGREEIMHEYGSFGVCHALQAREREENEGRHKLRQNIYTSLDFQTRT